jgi:Flp pilus assembly protein TadG
MVEIAVALPLLIMIILGLIEIGIIFASYVSLVNATREGAIFASMHPEIIGSSCGSTPNAYPLPEGTAGYCTVTPGDDNMLDYTYGATATVTTTVWSEYYNRVSNEVFVVSGETLRRAQLLTQDTLTLQRPVPDPSCSSPIGTGCMITVTVLYNLHTLTSDVSLPFFGRLGLPSYYRIKYNMVVPVR